jgi:putative transposase
MLYLGWMRYPDGGGLTAAGRARREAVRLQAAEWFDQDVAVSEIAKRLRVSENAVYRWRRQWRADGEAGLVSKGSSGADCRLSPEQQKQLAAALREGPAAHGWVEDQRWTLARVAVLIARLFGVQYTLRGVSFLLHRMKFSPQMPKHRPVERDEEAIATWREQTWEQAKS